MDYRFVGGTGLKVSALCMGTQTFGWGADESSAHRMADQFVEAGGNFFDTANSYNQGMSETILGGWLKRSQKRAQVVIATKVFFPVGDGPNDTGLSRRHIFEQIDASLRRLQTEYVDIYQMHCWDASTPYEETFQALNDLVRAGKVRYVGASNFTPAQIVRVNMRCQQEGWARIQCLQPEYSLLVRSPEWELLPVCAEEGVGVIAWSPLAGGWLTGKYHRDQPPPDDSRAGRGDRWDDLPEQRVSESTWQVIDVLRSIAQARGRTVPQVALNWLLQKPVVTAPIFGARTSAQLADNLGAVGWSLTGEEVDALDQASRIPLPSPYSFIARYTRRR